MTKSNDYENIIEEFSNKRKKRKRKKKKKKKKKLADELGMSVKDYSQEVKDQAKELKQGEPKRKKSEKEEMRKKEKYYWPSYKNPLDNGSIVQMNQKPLNNIERNIPYLYKKFKKDKFCIKLDNCKKIELKNDFLKKKLLKTEIKLGYLKIHNDKKMNEIDNLDKENKKILVNEGILILILIIIVGLLLFSRYYLSVLRKIKVFN